MVNITINGQKIKDVYNYNNSNYASLRYMVYTLNAITHEQNEAMPTETRAVVWSSNDKRAIFRITDEFTKELKVIEFSTEGLSNNSAPKQREVMVNGKPAGFISFVFHNNLNMIGVRELSKLAGLEPYLQWYNKDGTQYVDLRVEDPLYGHSDLGAAVDSIVMKQGGIPQSLNGEFYQVLYGTANKGGRVNRYSGYVFSVNDAIQWLIQTGGGISFVLQIRDTINAVNQVQTAVDGLWEIIRLFIQARGLLMRYGYTVRTPRFFVGSPEENVNVSSYGASGMIDIYNGVIGKLKAEGFSSAEISEVIAGIYFGSETAKTGIELGKISEYMKKQGAELLWIPYFFARDELREINEISIYFNKVILQPGIFYSLNRYYENYGKAIGYTRRLEDSEKWEDILKLIAKDQCNKYGVELEFDMGLVTGRGDRSPSMSVSDKRKAFMDYIDKIIPLIGKAPIGVYSGGPNEQGYNNIYKNSNLHNNQNHAPTVENFGTGSSYSDLYHGNLIYEINSALFSNRTNLSKRVELRKFTID